MAALNKKLLAVAAGLAVSSAPALAAFSFNGLDFVVNPQALGEPNAAFTTAGSINFSYTALVQQFNGAGNSAQFSEAGTAQFGSFLDAVGQAPLGAGLTGLTVNYGLYATFTALGNTTANGGSIDGTFSNFNVTFFLDRNFDTTFNTTTGAITGGNGDDISVLTGNLNVGQFRVSAGLAGGDFDVLFNVTGFGAAGMGFFSTLSDGSPLTLGDINGVNSSVTGVALPPNNFANGRIIGSGNVAFGNVVPEPASLALVGLALAGLGLSRRKARG